MTSIEYSDRSLRYKSRRSFLSAVGGSLTLGLSPLQAGGRVLEPLSFVVVCDTHLGYRDRERPARLWSKTAEELVFAKGDLVLHLGDLVDRGQEEQYPVYIQTRDTIGKPVHEIPGNHDPPALFRKYIREQVDTVVDHRWLRFLLMNNSRTESHDGFLRGEQIDWIDHMCRDAARTSKFVVLCMHVPAHSNKPPDRAWYVKPENGQTRLYETVKRHKTRILALMHGHFHNGIRGWDSRSPVHEICFPSALYNLDRRLEQKNAPGYNLPEFRPGYTLVTISNGSMKLQYKPTGSEESVVKDCVISQLKQ